MKEKIGISIIIPVFNSESYIASCIDSVLEQTYKNFEIICVNDGSSDKSSQIIENYVQKYPNKVKLINQENQGTGFARNAGIENSSGEYIGFLDSDDTLDKEMFEKLYNSARKYNSDVVVGGFQRIDEDTDKVLSNDMVSHSNLYIDVNKKNVDSLLFINPGPCNKIHKRNIFDDIRFTKIPVVDDLCLMLEYLPRINRISFVPEIVYYYKFRRNSLSNTLAYDTFVQLKDFMIKMKDTYIKNKFPEYYLEYIDKMAFIHIGISLLTKLSYRKDIDLVKEIEKTKSYLNKYFPYWKNFSFLRSFEIGNSRYIALLLLNFLYKLNLFILFLHFYKFLNNVLKRDIKW